MTLPRGVMTLEEEQREALEMRRYFTTMTRGGTRNWPRRMACLLVDRDDGDIEAVVEIGIVSRTYIPVATGGWHRLRHSRRDEVEPIGVAELLAEIDNASVRATLKHRIEAEGRLTPAAERAVRVALRKLRPKTAEDLERLIADNPPAGSRLSMDALQAAAQEADSVRLALRIAEISASEIEGVDLAGRPDDYRLSTGCCYLKLYRPVATLSATNELASGLYLRLERAYERRPLSFPL